MNLKQIDREFLEYFILTHSSRKPNIDDKDFLTFTAKSEIEMDAHHVEPKMFHKRKSLGVNTYSTSAQSNIGGMVSSI